MLPCRLSFYILFFLSTVGLGISASAAVSADASGTATSDPQATQLVSEAYATLIGNAPLSDIAVSGTGSWPSGDSTNTGSIEIQAKGTGMSRIVSAGTSITEVRNDSAGLPDGEWVGADGVTHRFAAHNCWIPAGWLLPQTVIISAMSNNVILTYDGQITQNGVTADQIHFSRILTTESAAGSADIAHLSRVDLLLDAGSHLPLSVRFNLHPDNDPSVDIPVEVHFSSYQNTSGTLLPLGIQQYLNGTLQVDIAVESVVVNSGIPDSAFTLQ